MSFFYTFFAHAVLRFVVNRKQQPAPLLSSWTTARVCTIAQQQHGAATAPASATACIQRQSCRKTDTAASTSLLYRYLVAQHTIQEDKFQKGLKYSSIIVPAGTSPCLVWPPPNTDKSEQSYLGLQTKPSNQARLQS